MTVAHSPGKLILAGEHAVLAGCPALAMASSPRVTCCISESPGQTVTLTLPGRCRLEVPQEDLTRISTEVQERHAHGLPPQSPEDLLLTALHRHAPGWTGQITFATDLPVGSGMGASAAFLLSLLKALQPDIPADSLYVNALALEHLQHGRSSGLDVWTSLQGGLWWVQGAERTRLDLPALPDFRIFHTGSPASTTGECVNQVCRSFPHDHSIWQDFAKVIHQTRSALEHQDSAAWSEAIRITHALLCRIGTVPESVQRDIHHLEAAGAVAKICGAGSIRGDGAGVVLVRDAQAEWIPQHWMDIHASFCTIGTSL